MSSSDTENSESCYTSTSHSKQYIIPHASNTWQSKMNLQLESLSNRIYLMEIYNKYPMMRRKPPGPKSRPSIHRRSESREKEEGQSLTNNSPGSDMRDTFEQQENSDLSENKESSRDGNESSDEQTRIQNEIEKKKQLRRLPNRSRTISPEKTNVSSKNVLLQEGFTPECHQSPQDKPKSMLSKLVFVTLLLLSIILVFRNSGTPQSQNNNENQEKNHNSIFKCIEDVKAKFHNQESDIWIEIESAINEVIISRTKTPSIILLFANETSTMNCLATKLADISKTILHTENENFNPTDFGEDCCDIIDRVKRVSSSAKVMVIRDILNINVKAIRALHFLCDRCNPPIEDVIYILTMKTSNYQPSEKKMTFVEKHIKQKLSNIDEDILMPLITRITDGTIISVQPESNLEHCETDS